MTSQQLINSLPLNVIASKKLLSSYGYMITPPINLGTKFKIISIENVGATTTGSAGNPNYKKIITNIPYNGIYLRLTLRLSDNSISIVGGDFVPFSDAIKIDKIDKKSISNKYTELSSSVDGVAKQKYKVVKGGFNYNGNVLKVGEIFEGVDTGAKFLDSPAITINYLGQSVNVPKENLVLAGDTDKLTDTKTLEDYNSKRNTIKSITKVVGLGGGLFLAHKMKKGTWGYIGFGLLGIIAGTFVGGQVSNVLIKQ